MWPTCVCDPRVCVWPTCVCDPHVYVRPTPKPTTINIMVYFLINSFNLTGEVQKCKISTTDSSASLMTPLFVSEPRALKWRIKRTNRSKVSSKGWGHFFQSHKNNLKNLIYSADAAEHEVQHRGQPSGGTSSCAAAPPTFWSINHAPQVGQCCVHCWIKLVNHVSSGQMTEEHHVF